MTETRRTTSAEAKRVGDEIGVDWSRVDQEHFRHGMNVEYEHRSHHPQTDLNRHHQNRPKNHLPTNEPRPSPPNRRHPFRRWHPLRRGQQTVLSWH